MNEKETTMPTTPKESRVSHNLKQLKKNPRLFLQKLMTWIKPMRKDYRRRWNRGLRDWLRWYPVQLRTSKVTWMGVKTQKMVLDCWVYQQIINEVRPEIIIEIGNADGGSTKFLANMLDLVGKGEVIAVDIDHSNFKGQHPRTSLVTGDSLSAETLARVAELTRGRKGLVIHDGDHNLEHALADLRAYSKFVAVGSYLIVEDTVHDLFPAGDGLGRFAGPMGAVEQFLIENRQFRIDPDCEFFLLTYNPCGYLKRLA
jgi:cephalosporin hydroxylase